MIEFYEKLSEEIIRNLDKWTHSYEYGLPTHEPDLSALKLKLMKLLEEKGVKSDLP